jgi:YHS domain-containing protein
LKVRFELENSSYVLRPDMFVDVNFLISLPPAVTVPADAVINSGQKETVFVVRGNGYFESRTVETGWRMGDRVQITNGLEPGERIVISGNFLLDSETRMKSVAATAMAAAQKDPVCGMDVDPAKSAGQSEYKGKTYYLCSAQCKQKFDKDPEACLGKQELDRRHD